ncbi:MAG: TolC family protein [Kiritimatiellae bacterium]|nr:TolC family protein [Kiritimatiellia bacterium]MDD4734557.1 TolC family protein [Kiritimatiellia bacterium]
MVHPKIIQPPPRRSAAQRNPAQRRGASAATPALLALLYLTLSVGCAVFSPPTPPETALFEDEGSISEFLAETTKPAGDFPDTPLALINAALSHNAGIRTRLHDIRRLDSSAGRARILRSPEIRLGAAQGNADASASRTESGLRQADSYETESGYTRDIVPLRTGPRSTANETSSSSSTRETSGSRYSWADLDDESWSVGLRLYPPNPWGYAAEVSRTEARLHAAEACLRQEQLAVTKDTAICTARILATQVRLQLLHQLESAARKQLALAEKRPVKDHADTLRRTLEIQSRLAKTQRELAGLLSDLARLTGEPVPPEKLKETWDWLPASAINREELAPLLRGAHTRRPEIALAYWQTCELLADYQAARADNIPWFRNIDVAYDHGNRDESGGYNSESSALQRERQGSTTYTDFADGDRRTSVRSSDGQTHIRQQETGAETASRSSDEWSVQAAIEIPLFQWFSGQSAKSRDRARAALADLQSTRQAARRDIRTQLLILRKSRNDLVQFKRTMLPSVRELAKRIQILRNSNLLRPDEYLQMLQQISDIALETRALEQAHLEARLAFWVACGAPFP